MSKQHLGIVVVGHVDAGKSTTTGRLLFELGGMTDRDLEKLKKEAHELGKDSFMFAFWMDKSRTERRRGLTIQCCTREFFTPSYHYTVIDAPGHRDFIKNMISGASQADVALLTVPANKGAFETSIAKGDHKRAEIQGQTRQHLRLCHLLGIEQLVVVVNKMDEASVNYSEARFNEIKDEVSKIVTKIGYKTRRIPFIPISGFNGDNLVSASDNMPWYKGFRVRFKKEVIDGHTLMDALETVMKPPKRIVDKPFRMPVSSLLKIKGVGDVVTGRIEQGSITPNVSVKFYPSGCVGKTFSIEMHHQNIERADCGDNVGISIKHLHRDHMPHVGDVMAIDDHRADPDPPKQAYSFHALVYVQDHPGKLLHAKLHTDGTYKGGFTPSVHIRTAKAPCQLIGIVWKLGKSTHNVKVDSPIFIEAGDEAEIVMLPKNPIVVCPFDLCKPLGRLAALDSNSLVLLGKVMSVEYKNH